MDAPHPKRHVEDHEKEDETDRKTRLLLAAYRDETLTVEAANQLVRMAEDSSYPVHAGEDLPTADKAALLHKAALSRNNS